MRIVLAVAMVSFAMLCFTSCTSSHGKSSDGGPLALENYRANLHEMEFLLEQGNQFFERSPGPSEAEYQALVDKYRQRGLDAHALSADDRQSLLMVAQIAFLAHADTLRYLVTAEEIKDATEDEHHGEAMLEEVYRHGEALTITARRIEGSAIDWSWGYVPAWNPNAPGEKLEFFDDTPQDAALWTVISRDTRTREYVCSTTKVDGSDWGLGHLEYYLTFLALARGYPIGPEVIDGRQSYKFQGGESVYWLDAETLWLRRYEYEQDGIRYTVRLLAINEDTRIEPPDVDVPCVEEAPSGEKTPGP